MTGKFIILTAIICFYSTLASANFCHKLQNAEGSETKNPFAKYLSSKGGSSLAGFEWEKFNLYKRPSQVKFWSVQPGNGSQADCDRGCGAGFKNAVVGFVNSFKSTCTFSNSGIQDDLFLDTKKISFIGNIRGPSCSCEVRLGVMSTSELTAKVLDGLKDLGLSPQKSGNEKVNDDVRSIIDKNSPDSKEKMQRANGASDA